MKEEKKENWKEKFNKENWKSKLYDIFCDSVRDNKSTYLNVESFISKLLKQEENKSKKKRLERRRYFWND